MRPQGTAHGKGIVWAVRLALVWLLYAIVAFSGTAAQQSLTNEYVLWIPAVAQHGQPFRVFLPIYAADTPGTSPYLPYLTDTSSASLGHASAFVTRVGEDLRLDGQQYTFIGTNVRYLAEPFFPEENAEKVIRHLGTVGVQVIRVAIKPGCALNRIERMLDLGGQYDIRFILTLQDFYGSRDGWWFKGKYETVDLPYIQEIVPRFAHRPEILMWELMNEPTCPPEDANPACWSALCNWAQVTSQEVKRLDPNHLVSLGTHRAGFDKAAIDSFHRIHALPTVDIISMHHGVEHFPEKELAIAHDLGKPIYWGEATMRGLKEDCQPISQDRLEQRALAVGEGIERSVKAGIDGYLLWQYAHGGVDMGSHTQYFCGVFDYFADDPVWKVIKEQTRQ